MVNIIMYNHHANRMEYYAKELSDPMPYNNGGTLTVGEFRARSTSGLIWSSSRVMEAWNTTRTAWGRPIYVGYAFRRIGEGGHANQSQHYAGTSFDAAQNMTAAERNRLRNLAENLGVWSYVEPGWMTPTWVHFDGRKGTPACRAGYPMLMEGIIGVYVCTLQDALATAGIPGIGVDGIFGPQTREAVVRFQRENGLGADGVVGCRTWTALTAMTNGAFRRG